MILEKRFKNRDKVFSYLDDYSSVVKIQANERKTVNTLLKSYIFEMNMLDLKVDLSQIFQFKDCRTIEIDEEMLQVFRGGEVVGFIEKVNSRFAVMHSIDTAQKSDYYTNSLLKSTPLLDSLWISGKMFDLFREKIRSQHSPHRYIKMKFEFNNIFSRGYSNEEFLNYSEYIDEGIFDDQVVTSIELVEELVDLDRKIEGVRSFFSAFCAVGLLRFPSRVGKGGHDFYRNGKVTNRSDSFFDHRTQIRETINDYKLITETLEAKTWLNFDIYRDKEDGVKFQGSPVVFKFPTPLKEQVFTNFIDSTFPNGSEPFKILGKPMWINNNKVHIYGTDINLWQKVNLELSREEFIIILPSGTCGNTIHRLVTNIQRYLDPEVEVYIGDQSYESFMKASIKGSAENE